MACEHKRLRCTDGVFYCLDCGCRLGDKILRCAQDDKGGGADTGAAAGTKEKKRGARKGAEKA